MIDHDKLFKELLTTFFYEFLELFLPEVAAYVDRSSITFLDKEVFTDIATGDKHEADIVAKVKFRDQDSFFLMHCENQSESRGGFTRRMFRYFARFSEKFDLPVYPIALFSFDRPLRPEPNRYEVVFPNRTVLTFSFDAIQLNRYDWHNYVNTLNPVASALMAKMKIARQDRPRVKAECLRLLVKLNLDEARTQLISGFVDTYLRLEGVEEQLFAQAVAQFVSPEKEQAMEIVTSWMEEGMQKEARNLVMRLAERKLGTLAESMKARITALSTSQLEELGLELLSLTNVDALNVWLDTQTAQSNGN
ncbi:MAG TPA: DUF4351 domain-containing protein [Chthonomonadaceae bacterium]|nr:DUF4351 domain-containing protein [Chthonomonadaceae bacterium]